MDFDEYLSLIERRFRKNCNILFDVEERGVKIDFFASSIFVSDDVYKYKAVPFCKYEIYEKYYIKTYDTITKCDIENYFHFLTILANEQSPSYQHLYKAIIGVIVCNHIDIEVHKTIKSMKYTKPYSMYFKGWSEIQLLCIDLNLKKIYFNNAAEKNSDFFLFQT